MADHDRGGQGASAFRAFLRELPDDIAKAREDGLPVVLERTTPLAPHAQRLMDSLGVEVRIVTALTSRGRDEIARGARTEGHFLPPYEQQVRTTGPRADWIDYRASIARVFKREDNGDEALTCSHCGTETDVTDVAHSPRCAVITGAAAAETTDIEEDTDMTVLEEPPVAAEPGVPAEEADETTPQDEASPDSAATSDARSPVESKWTREVVFDRLHTAVETLGRLPLSREYSEHGLPGPGPVTKVFGNWGNLCEEAGYPRPKRGQAPASVVSQRDRPAGAPAEPPVEAIRQLPPIVWVVKVPGTGLRYRTADEAYVAADEIEHDGERVAREARVAGQEGKADQAIDASRELAEKVRAAARAAEGGQPEELTADGPAAEHAAGGLPEPSSDSGGASTDLTLGLTLAQLAAAGAVMDAIGTRLVHLERAERRVVWTFLQPLIEKALDD